jgi:hypothetical protein
MSSTIGVCGEAVGVVIIDDERFGEPIDVADGMDRNLQGK